MHGDTRGLEVDFASKTDFSSTQLVAKVSKLEKELAELRALVLAGKK